MTIVLLRTNDKIIYQCDAEAFYLTRMRSSWHGYVITQFVYCDISMKFTVTAKKIKELMATTPFNTPESTGKKG